MSRVNVSTRYRLTLRRPDRPDRTLTLPTLSETLEAARVDAAWLRGIGTVSISPVLYVEAADTPRKG